MKYETPVNLNYVATIIEVKEVHALEGLDNLVSINAFGYQALVSKDTKPGDIGVLFTAESQLSEEFARMNNLHRHTDRNFNEKEAGYLEDSRRVKAIKLHGWRSDALFMSLDAFKYLKLKPEDFTVGDVFDKIGTHEIVKKYLLKEPGQFKGQMGKTRRVDLKVFPMHIDTTSYYRNSDKIPNDAQIVVTQKLHGSSGRFGRVPVERDLTFLEKITRRLGVKVSTTDYRFVAGSRTVVKSIEGIEEEGKQHYYGLSDIWTAWGEKIKDTIPNGWLVFGEIVGFTDQGQPIQKSYTYNQLPNTSEFYIYRVAVVNDQGRVVDLGWDSVREFAVTNGLKHVPELWRGAHYEFDPDEYMNGRYADDASPGFFSDQPIKLSSPKTVDEGVVVRYDVSYSPFLTKAKASDFLAFETAELDKGIIDIESEES